MNKRRILETVLSGAAAAVGLLTSCVSGGFTNEPEPVLRQAWALYRDGRFAEARAAADRLLEAGNTADAGRYLLCLISHLQGDYLQSTSHYDRIRRSYPKRKLLVEPVAWSYVHLGDYEGALRHLKTSGVRQDPALFEVLAYWKDQPLTVEASGVVEIPFTEDRLSPFMPGLKVRINGRDAVARLDTGGGYVHLSPAWAERLGVRSTGREKGFASLQKVDIGYGGFVDLELGSFVVRNLPVYVMTHLEAQSEAIRAAVGEELGPILGTNVFQRFLTTIDGPGRRFVLSPRGDPAAAAAHAARLPGDAKELPFALWLDHYMIARGEFGGKQVKLFFDSGLVAMNPEQGQAHLLASVSRLGFWGVPVPEKEQFAVVPRPLALSGLGSGNPTAVPVPETTWKGLGDWGGVGVDALISWGFLKEYAWTLDFDRMTYAFRKPAGRGGW